MPHHFGLIITTQRYNDFLWMSVGVSTSTITYVFQVMSKNMSTCAWVWVTVHECEYLYISKSTAWVSALVYEYEYLYEREYLYTNITRN